MKVWSQQRNNAFKSVFLLLQKRCSKLIADYAFESVFLHFSKSSFLSLRTFSFNKKSTAACSSPRENCKSRKKEPMIAFFLSWHFFFAEGRSWHMDDSSPSRNQTYDYFFLMPALPLFLLSTWLDSFAPYVRAHYDNAHVGDDFCAGVGWDSRLRW